MVPYSGIPVKKGAGFSEGVRTLVIGAPGRKHYVMRVVLKPGETRMIDLALPPR